MRLLEDLSPAAYDFTPESLPSLGVILICKFIDWGE